MLERKFDRGARPRTMIVNPNPHRSDPEALKYFNLRPGMWVRTNDGQTGILTFLNYEGVAVVMLVNGDGTNKLELQLDANTLTQANYEHIPNARKHVDEAEFRKMGYVRGEG